jgi:hypothetical protein
MSCKSTSHSEKKDVLSNLIKIHQSGKLETLVSIYGSPTRIENTDQASTLRYNYDGVSASQESFIAFVDTKKGIVISSATMFWKSHDDYELLKKRFGNYQWKETYIPTSAHPLRELYKVEIPQLGMSFEHDKLSPKIDWIFLKAPEMKR